MPIKDTLNLEDIIGITSEIAEKLRSKSIFTVEALAITTPRELVEIVGAIRLKSPKSDRQIAFNEDIARTFIQNAREKIDIKFMTAKDLMEHRKTVRFLTTGVNAINDILGGGYEAQALTELGGSYGSGKTNLSVLACVTVQLPEEKGGLDGGAIFIDTESTFRPENVSRCAKRLGLMPSKVMDRILYGDAFNSAHQMLMVQRLDKQIKEINAKLIVVDSLTSHFRAEYIGRETLPPRQQNLNAHIHMLLKWAKVFNLVCIVTTQVHARPDQMWNPPPELANPAVGGHVLAHGATHRLYLRTGSKNTRIVKVYDSPNLPPREATFIITGEGSMDVPAEDKKTEGKTETPTTPS